jgi:hypothetical protein
MLVGFLLILLVLPMLAIPMRAYAANVDIAITSMTADPANSVTLPSSGYVSVSITVYFHNYAAFSVSGALNLDYRGFSIVSSGDYCPGAT